MNTRQKKVGKKTSTKQAKLYHFLVTHEEEKMVVRMINVLSLRRKIGDE